MASVVRHWGKKKKKIFCPHSVESWHLGYPPPWAMGPKAALPHNLLATYWENPHIPVTLQFRSGKRDFARTTYSFMVLAWCLWVAPAQWRSHWQAWSWFKLQSWFLSDQIIWFWVWPGADLELTSIFCDLWERRGQRPGWNPVFSAAGFPCHLFPHSQARASFPGIWRGFNVLF